MVMRYLGALRGAGTLQSGDETLADADYDFDGYVRAPGGITANGEIRAAPEVLRRVFGRRDLKLVTEDGRRLGLRFSEKKLAGEGDAAHVDITDGLPDDAAKWRA
jgi:hypothetical protein